MNRRPDVHLLAIDVHARRMTRYLHRPGSWGALEVGRAEIPEESVSLLGAPEMAPILARFRMTGTSA